MTSLILDGLLLIAVVCLWVLREVTAYRLRDLKKRLGEYLPDLYNDSPDDDEADEKHDNT